MDQAQLNVWESTFKMEPEEDEKFFSSKVEKIANKIMQEKLNKKSYSIDDGRIWSVELCSEIRKALKELKMPRYKLIVQVTIGENSGQDLRVSSKSLWDVNLDNWGNAVFVNRSIFAVAMIFGCYYE